MYGLRLEIPEERGRRSQMDELKLQRGLRGISNVWAQTRNS